MIRQDRTYGFLVLFFLALFSSSVSFAQDAALCTEYRSNYGVYLQQNQLQEARTFWQLAMKHCTEKDKKLFVNGAKIYNKLIASFPGPCGLKSKKIMFYIVCVFTSYTMVDMIYLLPYGFAVLLYTCSASIST